MSKSRMLEKLYNQVTKSIIKYPYIFTVEQWQRNSRCIIDEIQRIFTASIIVRSSTCDEDQNNYSNAGKYESIMNVNTFKDKEIEDAVNCVISHYDTNKKNEVLIQHMVTNVKCSGVILTYDFENNVPYYLIQYNDTTRDTSYVTSGTGNDFEYIRVLKDFRVKDKKIRKLIAAVQEVEKLVNSQYLDIEFAIDQEDVIILFQVRQLIVKKECDTETRKEVIHKIANDVEFDFDDGVSGSKTIYTNMSDWNPAELIGVYPPILDYSLYLSVFTDSAWHKGRELLGYKKNQKMKLTRSFGGYIYVDIRRDINSYLPSGLHDYLESKIVDFYISKIERRKELFDKIEFDVVDTCYTVLTDKSELRQCLHDNEWDEFSTNLCELTNDIILDRKKVISRQIEAFNRINVDEQISDDSFIQNKYRLSLLKKIGFIYSVIVRAAFVAYKQVIDLKECGLISEEEFASYFSTFTNITKLQNRDLVLLKEGKLSKEQFWEKHKGIRENMFSITGELSYSNLDLNCVNTVESDIKTKNSRNIIFEREAEINVKLYNTGLLFDLDQLVKFTEKVLFYREFVKNKISYEITLIFNSIAKYFRLFNVTKKEIQHISIEKIFLYWNKIDELKKEANINRKNYERNKNIPLPDVIVESEDIYCIKDIKAKPNFVGNEIIREEIFNYLKKDYKDMKNLKDKIVVIEKADPGFDWLFSYGIKGLITCYGGVASHMALRANELNITAIIGCGKEIYKKILKGKVCEINPEKKMIILDDKEIYNEKKKRS